MIKTYFFLAFVVVTSFFSDFVTVFLASGAFFTSGFTLAGVAVFALVAGAALTAAVTGFAGYWGLGKLGISLGSGWLGYILTAALGAIVLLAILNLIIKKT